MRHLYARWSEWLSSPRRDFEWKDWGWKFLLGWVLTVAMMWAVLMLPLPARAAPLTGSQVLTRERSDAGETYAALSVVLEYALTPQWSIVLTNDQAVTLPSDRYAEWDTSIAWRPGDEWSLSVGRRWRVGPPPDYGGPWTYVQVWRRL